MSPFYEENKVQDFEKFQVKKVNINFQLNTKDRNSHFILKVHRHILRNVTTYDNDIAIITLDRNVPFTSLVKPICVGDESIKVKPGDQVTRALPSM